MWNEAGEIYVDAFRAPFPAQLTSMSVVGGVPQYAWTEQTFDTSTGAYTAANPARSGTTTSSQAYEINNEQVSVPTYATLRLRGIVGGQPVYEFAAEGGASFTSLTQSFTSSTINYAGETVNILANSTENVSNGVTYTVNLGGSTAEYLYTGGGIFSFGSSISFLSLTVLVIDITAIGSGTTTPAIIKENTTAATAGVPVQNSPVQDYIGQVYDTGAAASKNMDFMTGVQGTSGNPASAEYMIQGRVGTGSHLPLLAVTAPSGNVALQQAGAALQLQGATSGTASLVAPATGGGTLTLPSGTGTLATTSSTGDTYGTVTAAGTTQGTAATLPNTVNNVSGADGTKGVILDGTVERQVIYNNSGVSALKLYPPTGGNLGAGVNTASSLAFGTAWQYVQVVTGGSSIWKSVQLN